MNFYAREDAPCIRCGVTIHQGEQLGWERQTEPGPPWRVWHLPACPAAKPANSDTSTGGES
jgi:hypothetical protein